MTPSLLLLGVLGALYFLPTVIAGARGHHQLGAIAVIDIFLGWTFLGWVVALAMACGAVKAPIARPAATLPASPPLETGYPWRRVPRMDEIPPSL